MDTEAILKLPVEEKLLSIGDLKFDPNNERWFHKFQSRELSQDQIFGEVKNDNYVNLLKKSILGAGEVAQSLVIDKDGTVKEGNGRLAALRLIQEDPNVSGDIKKRLHKVKCLIFPEGTTEEQKLRYLALIHVRGRMPWSPFDKAHCIYELYHDYKNSYEEISTQLGMSKSTISRILNAYAETIIFRDKYASRLKKPYWEKYSFFDELYKRRDLKDWRETPGNPTKFCAWVFDEKFHDVRDVRRLAMILKDKELLAEFEKNNMRNAYELAAKRLPSLSNPSLKKIHAATQALQSLTARDFIEILQDPLKESLLKNLNVELNQALREVDDLKKAVKTRGE